MKKSFIVALAAMSSFACSAVVDQEGEEVEGTSEQALGTRASAVPLHSP
jgi:hypothetical protein